MRFVYVPINLRQPCYNFYITHLNWPTNHSCSTKILKQQNLVNKPGHRDQLSHYHDKCLLSKMTSACECASGLTVLKESGGVRERTKVMPKNILLAFVTVEITVALGNGRPGRVSARLCHNADASRMCAEWVWTSNKTHMARIYNFPCSPEGWNLHVLF